MSLFSLFVTRMEVIPPGVQIWKRKDCGLAGGPKADAARAAACMAPKKISSTSAYSATKAAPRLRLSFRKWFLLPFMLRNLRNR